MKSGKDYYDVIELDSAFNNSIVMNSSGKKYPTIQSGLPKMLDETGIPRLKWIEGEQPWTAPRPFWDEAIAEIKRTVGV